MAVQSTRLPFVFAGIALVLLVLTILHQSSDVSDRIKSTFVNGVHQDASTFTTNNDQSFYDIALSHGTDKVTKHHYHLMYQKYLEPYRNKRLKMLEIGLGCDMSYGPGASYYTWLDYFPDVDLFYIEYDSACAAKWANETEGATIFAGDQADIAFLNDFMADAGTDFDVIIDDGGHRMNQQIVSLEVLWRAVKPGGIYFCEDLQTSYWEAYGGDPTNSGRVKTMMGMVKELVDDLHVGPGGHRRQHEVSTDMQAVDCMEEVCAFIKKQS